jgi:acrylyl-CoA reductase (NADPH)/3-hydroxypropionyl-CoA dehydratase/3-hydroxypropionyl-CoA synthetase
MGVAKDPETGARRTRSRGRGEAAGVPDARRPGPNEALVFVLASEMNFNDIWAITGIPVSPFDARDADVQVTGSGGVAWSPSSARSWCARAASRSATW